MVKNISSLPIKIIFIKMCCIVGMTRLIWVLCAEAFNVSGVCVYVCVWTKCGCGWRLRHGPRWCVCKCYFRPSARLSLVKPDGFCCRSLCALCVSLHIDLTALMWSGACVVPRREREGGSHSALTALHVIKRQSKLEQSWKEKSVWIRRYCCSLDVGPLKRNMREWFPDSHFPNG